MDDLKQEGFGPWAGLRQKTADVRWRIERTVFQCPIRNHCHAR